MVVVVVAASWRASSQADQDRRPSATTRLENKKQPEKMDKVHLVLVCFFKTGQSTLVLLGACTSSEISTHLEKQTMHTSGPLRLAADVFRRHVRRRSLQPPLAVAATSPFPSIRLLASCWSSCSENDTTPLGAFHGSRSVPRPPRHCVFPRSRATGCPVAVAVGAARNL